ncbi:unnamed protein product, partial [Ascophyllum nodosum]
VLSGEWNSFSTYDFFKALTAFFHFERGDIKDGALKRGVTSVELTVTTLNRCPKRAIPKTKTT